MFILVVISQEIFGMLSSKRAIRGITSNKLFWHQEEVPVGNKFKNKI